MEIQILIRGYNQVSQDIGFNGVCVSFFCQAFHPAKKKLIIWIVVKKIN